MEQYKLYYNNFIDILLTIFKDELTINILLEIKKLSDNEKIKCGNNFNNSISNANFKFFLESKIKLFSHKSDDTIVISQSLFNNKLCIKDILNNQSTEIKKIIWLNLHNIYLNVELLKNENEQNKQQISKLKQQLHLNDEVIDLNATHLNEENNTNQDSKTIQQLLDVDVNTNTNSMLDDIVGSFQNILSGNNAMSGIMDVSQKISQKYADQINNGDIELDKLMESITKKVPAIGEMMKMMPTGNKKTEQPQYVMDENFSTASVPLGTNNESTTNVNIGNMLKMANGMGLMPNLGASNPEIDDNHSIPGMDNIQTLLGFVNKMENSENKDNVKEEMDTFLQKNLGIDMNKFNDDIKKLM